MRIKEFDKKYKTFEEAEEDFFKFLYLKYPQEQNALSVRDIVRLAEEVNDFLFNKINALKLHDSDKNKVRLAVIEEIHYLYILSCSWGKEGSLFSFTTKVLEKIRNKKGNMP